MSWLAIVMFALMMLFTAAACGSDDDSSAAPQTTLAPDPDLAKFCDLMQQTDSVEMTDPSRELGFSAEEMSILEQIRAAAPEEIRDDISLGLDNAIAAFNAFQDRGGDKLAIQDMVAQINSPESQAADERVQAYVAENCGFDTRTGKDIPIGPEPGSVTTTA